MTKKKRRTAVSMGETYLECGSYGIYLTVDEPDVYRPASAVLTPDDARELARSLVAAADVWDQDFAPIKELGQ